MGAVMVQETMDKDSFVSFCRALTTGPHSIFELCQEVALTAEFPAND